MTNEEIMKAEAQYESLKDKVHDQYDEIQELKTKINNALNYIDRLLEFGIRNEEIDLTEIKMYLKDKNYKDITLRNLEGDENETNV